MTGERGRQPGGSGGGVRPEQGRVRRREAEDLGACVAVLADVHVHSGYPHQWPGDPAGWLTPAGMTAAWVAELDGKVVGHAALCGNEVSRLYVAPGAHGRGLGARLLDTIDAEAAARGLRLVLEVKTSNVAAVALYERRGWVRRCTERQWWGAGATAEEVEVHHYDAPARTPGAAVTLR
ncbi:GNAT family N-acetyltransferase [Streptomyces sp. RS10V-4]|uniref:GNAT family N-acetyltransferase n=1 Tax=Streptomyces rhizoryzae TaxID=2932493 RepID=UPI0020057269|nr:GNAT family N-acetyltransferase [Streptomyces rhizoryzae]MCK7622883.1 GNAT family N-acetyltransferase [Streptomyces rhizoryzae]